ncbi:MAG: Nif3-like dinuclear metal center hexameric protein [Ruminococcus sp.]|nr:Nif3-like dinuclear metal center hexameric protein [Candidatus Apopatosoma intestinale]
MSTVGELYDYFDRRIPSSLSCEWDNDGLMVCGGENRTVRRALFALDVTDAVADYAIENGYDLILSHHPMIFSPLKNLSGRDAVGARAIRLLKGGVSVFSFHTRLDAAEDGVNDILAEIFGLTDVSRFGPEGEEMGRIGTLPVPLPLDDFVRIVEEKLSHHIAVGRASGTVSRLALLGGGGRDFVRSAVLAGADTYLTGELGYHTLVDTPITGINLIEVGHYESEVPISLFYRRELAEHFPEISLDLYPRGSAITYGNQ